MRILAVDDDPVVLSLLEGALCGDGMDCELISCTSAEEAIETMESEIKPFDCFLLDVMLPGIDGIELCDTIRQVAQYGETPIIMITASLDPDLMGRAFYAGATDYVTKPLSGIDLGARINTASKLNNSMLREREAQYTLAEMTAKMRLRFDEALKLETTGVTDLATMENDLLRLPQGCYAMHLFTVDVEGLRDMHERVSAPAFRQSLEQVARAVTASLQGATWKLAYAGSGRFAGIVMGRRRLDPEELIAGATRVLARDWDAERCETETAPDLSITALSDQRLWSGRAAGDHLHTALTDIVAQGTEDYEDMGATYALAAE